MDILELGNPVSPYGVKGVGEPPTISSPAAVAAALRAATGRALRRIPIRPEHITGLLETSTDAVADDPTKPARISAETQ